MHKLLDIGNARVKERKRVPTIHGFHADVALIARLGQHLTHGEAVVDIAVGQRYLDVVSLPFTPNDTRLKFFTCQKFA
jgi:hypothetical protein